MHFSFGQGVSVVSMTLFSLRQGVSPTHLQLPSFSNFQIEVEEFTILPFLLDLFPCRHMQAYSNIDVHWYLLIFVGKWNPQ